jgi:hypothetical protein
MRCSVLAGVRDRTSRAAARFPLRQALRPGRRNHILHPVFIKSIRYSIGRIPQIADAPRRMRGFAGAPVSLTAQPAWAIVGAGRI